MLGGLVVVFLIVLTWYGKHGEVVNVFPVNSEKRVGKFPTPPGRDVPAARQITLAASANGLL
jgi:hypothetical protein